MSDMKEAVTEMKKYIDNTGAGYAQQAEQFESACLQQMSEEEVDHIEFLFAMAEENPDDVEATRQFNWFYEEMLSKYVPNENGVAH